MKSALYGKSCFLKELSIILEIKEKKEKLQIIKNNMYSYTHRLNTRVNFPHWPQVLYIYVAVNFLFQLIFIFPSFQIL